jgi:precorrin-3B synthase
MATGDGLLVRVHPPGGVLAADQARLLAALAREGGNGHLDVTARGNIQIRGVSESAYPGLAARLDGAGLVEPDGGGPPRLTLVSPLAGRDPAERFDVPALAAAVEVQARGLPGLPPKAAVAIDGGGAMSLHGLAADLHLAPAGAAGSRDVALGLAAPDGPRWIGTVTPEQAPAALRAILSRFGAARQSGRTAARRIRDLDAALFADLAAAAGLGPIVAPPRAEPALRAGTVRSGDQTAFLAALPFGRCEAAVLDRAAAWSERFGCGEVRLSFTRGLLLPGIADSAIPALAAEVREAGLIVDPADPRLQVIACVGAPACAAACAPTQAHAALLAEALRPLLARGAKVHVSGCAKGCAHPGPADLTLVGGRPAYAVLAGGAPADATPHHLTLSEIMTRLAPIDSPDALARAFGPAS